MGNFILKRNQVLSLVTALFIFAIVLPGCKKQIDQTTETNIKSSTVVTMDQIKQWGSSFLPTLTDQPTLLYDLAQKRIVNGRDYVRVQALGSGNEILGSFYFTKSDSGKLQALYVVTDQQDKTKLDGTVGFADFENQTYTVAKYQNNKPVALYSLKDNKALFDGVFTNNATGSIRKQVDDACAEQTSIIKLPDGRDSVIYRKVNSGIPCPGHKTFWQKLWEFLGDVGDFLFGWIDFGGSGGGSGGYTGGGSFGSGGYGGWDFSGYASGYSGGGSYGGGDPGGGWGPYDPFSSDNGIVLDDSDPGVGYDAGTYNGNVDNSYYQIIDPTKPFPLVNDIMGTINFVKRRYPTENCLDLAREQLAKLSYHADGWDPGGQTFQIYWRATGVDRTETTKGISYLVKSLQDKIPVLIGLDYGSPTSNKDKSTNHFVVVVGMGSNNGRNYFTYYDNLTSYTLFGASPLNRLYYDNTSGLITGQFDCPGASKHYTVAQIRKSYK